MSHRNITAHIDVSTAERKLTVLTDRVGSGEFTGEAHDLDRNVRGFQPSAFDKSKCPTILHQNPPRVFLVVRNTLGVDHNLLESRKHG